MSVFEKWETKVYKYRYRCELLMSDINEPIDETTLDGLLDEAVTMRQLSGFYRHPETEELCVRGRHVKAMVKEAANIRWAKDRWGPTNKGTRSFFAEHVFVLEDWIPLGRTAPDGVDQRFVHTWRGDGIQYDEYVEDAKVSFTVLTDHRFTKNQWAELWVTATGESVAVTMVMMKKESL